MKVAITGMSGYLGRLLMEALDRDSSVQSILGLDLVPPKLMSPKVEFQIADMRSSDFSRILNGVDVVYHLAFIVAPLKNDIFNTVEQVNVQGSIRLFQGAMAAGVSKIIYVSSIAAYGAHPDNPDLLTEEAPLRPNPEWYYSRTKGQVEAFLDSLEQCSPETTIIRLRPCTVLGPTSNTRFRNYLKLPVLPRFRKDLKLDFCWDQDIVNALMLARGCQETAVFNLSGGRPLTLEAMAGLLGKPTVYIAYNYFSPLLRASCRIGALPRSILELLETGLRYSINVSAEKARRQLGWSPRFDSAGAFLEFTKRSGME